MEELTGPMRASQRSSSPPLVLPKDKNFDFQKASSITTEVSPAPFAAKTKYTATKPRYSRRVFLGLILAGSAVTGSATGTAAWLTQRSSMPSVHTPIPIPIKYNTPYTYHYQDEVFTAAWSPDGRSIASAGGNKATRQGDMSIHIRAAMTDYDAHTHVGHSQLVRMVAWSPDNSNRIASASEDHTVKVWDAFSDSNPLNNYTGHTDEIMALAWSPDGKYIASASLDLTIQIWNSDTGEFIRQHKITSSGAKNPSLVAPVSWSPDGTMLVSTNANWSVVDVWSATTGETLYMLPSPTASVIGALAWSPDGKYIAAGYYSDSNSVCVWNMKAERPIPVFLDASNSQVYSVAWSPDSKYIAAGYNNNQVKIWSPAFPKQSHTYPGHKAAVMSVQWSPNGKYIASGGFDKTVQIWTPFA